MPKIDVFLICPVRGATDDQRAKIIAYVEDLESQGLRVYYPQRDTNQDDVMGARICRDNRDAINEAKEIHIWWSASSSGTLFDLGMAWMLKKPLVVVNRDEVMPTEGKSFQNVILNWSDFICE
jgi:nucleoside 2-deoxyribosyltransferase